MTYVTGLQFVNHSPFKIIAGSICYLTSEVASIGFDGAMGWTQKQDGDTIIYSGPLDLEANTWIDRPITLYPHLGGTILLRITLTLDNHEVFKFTVDQKWAYQNIDEPQRLPVTEERDGSYKNVIGIACTTRNDDAIHEVYAYGLVMATISDISSTARWMTDNEKISSLGIHQITLPGTHDTGTWSNSGNAQCQTMDLAHQLEAGIRFLDLRVEYLSHPLNDDMYIYHGGASTDYLFEADIVTTCEAFLARNPGEAIVMMVCRNLNLAEGALKTLPEPLSEIDLALEAEFRALMARILDKHPIIMLSSDFPTLKDARGRIVLVTRYVNGPGIPLPQVQWPDDTTGSILWDGVNVEIQDMYKFGGPFDKPGKVDHKWAVVEQHLDAARAAGNNDPSTWYINFTSGSGDPTIFDPDDMAKGIDGKNGINERLIAYLTKHPKGYYGAVVMDFPEFPPSAGLIRRLIDSNL